MIDVVLISGVVFGELDISSVLVAFGTRADYVKGITQLRSVLKSDFTFADNKDNIIADRRTNVSARNAQRGVFVEAFD